MTFAWEPAPVVGGAYSDDTRPWSVQDCVNWIPVQIERPGGRSDSMLRCAPGASVFCIPGPAAPVRGLHDVEGKLFSVVGSTLYQITPTGVAIPRGTIPGVGRVSMAHNQIAGGNELVIGNGQSGYVYNTSTETLAQITDDGFPGFKVCDYVDSYIAGVEPRGRFWFHSDLADATSYNTLDRSEAESQPDRIVSLVVSHREVFVLGERTGEFFRNVGTSTGTFQRADGTEMEVGCAATFSVCRMDNSVFWLGNDGCVYRLNGYAPVRISTRPMEQAISRCNLAEAFAFTYEDRGHKVYYLTFPDGMTWGFDASTGEWARRQSFGLDRWRMNCMVRWNKQWIAGDFVNGKLYRIEWDQPWENGEVVERRRITGVLHGNQNRITIDALELVFDTGTEAVEPGDLSPEQPAGPTISGEAPDGVVGEAYTYTYTITAGDSAILRTTIDESALLGGLSWNQATATLSGTPTANGSMTITPRVVDVNGLWAELTDTINIPVILPAQLSDWRYLQIANTDNTDYSDPDFDDSSWAIGAAPFGGWNADPTASQIAQGAPSGLLAAPAFDPRFASTFGTAWEVWTRLWLRRTLYLTAIPEGNLSAKVYIDDNCRVYINGDLVIDTPAGHDGGIGQVFTIPADSLVVGDNIIAIRCRDEEPGASTSVVYIDLLIEEVA